nr:immunoglobulin light chain junction region [Macaca mulatta]
DYYCCSYSDIHTFVF